MSERHGSRPQQSITKEHHNRASLRASCQIVMAADHSKVPQQSITTEHHTDHHVRASWEQTTAKCHSRASRQSLMPERHGRASRQSLRAEHQNRTRHDDGASEAVLINIDNMARPLRVRAKLSHGSGSVDFLYTGRHQDGTDLCARGNGL